MSELSFEKQFTHRMFCQNIQDIELETAKKLLADLHMLYLGQQALFVELAKRESLKDFGSY